MTESEWLASTDPVAMLEHLQWYEARILDTDGEPSLTTRTRRDVSARKLRLFACACCRLVWDRLVDDYTCNDCYGTGMGVAEDQCAGRAYKYRIKCPQCHGTSTINRSRRVVEIVERFADGAATGAELDAALAMAYYAWRQDQRNPPGLARYVVLVNLRNVLVQITRLELVDMLLFAAQADLLRCVFGNPYRHDETPGEFGLFVRGWLTTTVLALARAAYNERLPNGTLSPDALAVLADALEDAGCGDSKLLGHLRATDRECRTCGGIGEVGERGGKLRKNRVGTFACDDCIEGRVPAVHARGCWAVDLILGKS
jgi:hypothetical protein